MVIWVETKSKLEVTQPFSHIDSKIPYPDKRVHCQRKLDDHLHGNEAKILPSRLEVYKLEVKFYLVIY